MSLSFMARTRFQSVLEALEEGRLFNVVSLVEEIDRPRRNLKPPPRISGASARRKACALAL